MLTIDTGSGFTMPWQVTHDSFCLLAGKRFKSTNKEEKCGLKGPAASDISEGRVNEVPFRSQRRESQHLHRLEQKGICSRTGMRGSVPSQGPKLVDTSIQRRIDPWQKLPTGSGRSFRQPAAIVKCEHTQASRKQYLCSDCGKTFFMFLALKAHQRTHTDHERSQARGAGHTV